MRANTQSIYWCIDDNHYVYIMFNMKLMNVYHYYYYQIFCLKIYSLYIY